MILSGLTPSELRTALATGAAGAQVLPAEAFTADYAKALPALLGYPPLIAAGHLTRTRALAWLESGAIGVWPTSIFADHLAVDLFLDELRAEVQTWRLAD